MKPKAIIFDMDGVLVDVSRSYRLAIKDTVEFFSNQDISFEEIQDMKNTGGSNNDWDLTENILLTRDINISKDLIISKFQELFLGDNFDGYINNDKLIIEKDILRKLSNRYDLAIVTGRPRKETLYTLKKFGIFELFNSIVTLEDIPTGKQKPDPYGLSLVMKELKTESCLYLGDTIDDMRIGIALKVPVVGVLPPKTDGKLRALLIENGAKVVLDDINKIEEVLK